jgi:hypothetical protein
LLMNGTASPTNGTGRPATRTDEASWRRQVLGYGRFAAYGGDRGA